MTQDLPGGGRTVLVTGASSGIGAALAERFARAGFNLVLVARSEDKLRQQSQDLAAAARRPRLGGAGRPVAARRAATGRADAARRRPDGCAGQLRRRAGPRPLFDMAAARHRALIDLNVLGLTDDAGVLRAGMLARGRGRVLNVASIAAFQPVPCWPPTRPPRPMCCR